MSRSKNSRKTKNKKTKAGQTPYAARIIQAWQRMEEADGALDELIRIGQMEETQGERLSSQWESASIQFGELLTRAYDEGVFKRTVASVKHQTLSASSPHGPGDFIRLMEHMANFHTHAGYILQAQDGTHTPVRAAIYGVPVGGSKESLKDMAADPEFTALQRASGLAPDNSNVISMGVMRAADALELSLDPEKMWNLARHVLKTQAQSMDNAPRIKGLIQKGADDEPGQSDATTVGGYVILIGVFAAGDEPIEAVDGPEDTTFNAWEQASEEYEEAKGQGILGYMDTPCDLADAAKVAIAMQMMQHAVLNWGMDHPQSEVPHLKDCAFVYSQDESDPEVLDMVARFEDSSQIRVPAVLPQDMFPFLGDIVEEMTVPATVTSEDELPQWHELVDGADADSVFEAAEDSVVKPPRAKLH